MNIRALTYAIILTGSASGESANSAEEPCSRGALSRLTSENYENRIWHSLETIRELERRCRIDDSAGSPGSYAYRQYRAQLESFVGNHELALKFWDGNAEPRDRNAESKDAGNDFASLPTNVRALSAVSYIVDQVAKRGFQIVVVNERHHASNDRLLTLALLDPLAKRGFRYLAIEAGWRGDDINGRGYPLGRTGYYVNDVVFAEMLRDAISLGYRIVAYEAEQEQRTEYEEKFPNPQKRRDFLQAQNVVTRIHRLDPQAKVLIHCGYAHANEVPTAYWSPMAYYLKEATGIDPLTIDQTALSERSAPEFEHPGRVDAASRGLLKGEAIVLMGPSGEVLNFGRQGVDINVLTPRTRYRDGRPSWMAMEGRRVARRIDTPECSNSSCIVEARHSKKKDSVPYDRMEVSSQESAVLYLPPGENVKISLYGLDGTTLGHRTVH